MGCIWNALEKGYLEDPRSACCTDDMFEIFVRFGRCLCSLLPLFVNTQLPCLHTNSHHVLLLPPMHHKSFWCARARSAVVRWVQVHEPRSQAKKARTSRSQQPACTHKEHQILTYAEATAFAAQFLDWKVYPTKASQHKFLATCIDVDVENSVKHAHWHKYTRKRRGHR